MKRIASVILLVVFLSVLFLGLFNISGGMGMTGMESNCVFMSHGETLCPMSIADHLSSWQSVFISIAPQIVMLLSILAVASILSTPPHLLPQKTRLYIPIFRSWFKERTYTFTYRHLQDLFSRGILHPKLF